MRRFRDSFGAQLLKIGVWEVFRYDTGATIVFVPTVWLARFIAGRLPGCVDYVFPGGGW